LLDGTLGCKTNLFGSFEVVFLVVLTLPQPVNKIHKKIITIDFIVMNLTKVV